MSFIHRLRRVFSPAPHPAADPLYRACVAQARLPVFYTDFGVPDTVDGRFDMLVLHVFLVLRQLKGEARASQQLFDLMFADMDKNLREMGVGDMSVGKKIRPMISAFYGRAKAYEGALRDGGDTLRDTLARNIYGRTPPAPEALQAMTDYVRRAASRLDGQPSAQLLQGQVDFAEPRL
ncbi:MAG: ubiquinol-cytochrome C chaperone family protein [Bdellovibrionales bacterium]